MASIEDILARAKPRSEVVTICLAGDLRAEHTRLTEALEKIQEQSIGRPKTMASSSDKEARGIAEAIQRLEAQMAESSQDFTFYGVSDEVLEGIREKYPPREGKRENWNVQAAGPALVAACAVDPKMTEDQAVLLQKSLANGDWDSLVEGAWSATASKDQSIPFSVRASVLTAGSGSK